MKMNTSKYNELQQTISELLKQSKIDWTQVLSEIIASYNCSTGTIHFLEKGTSLLNVQAYQGIP